MVTVGFSYSFIGLIFFSLLLGWGFFWGGGGCLASVSLCQPAEKEEEEARRVGVEVVLQGHCVFLPLSLSL